MSITIPASITSIENRAFDECYALAEIHYGGDVAGWCGISGLHNLMSNGKNYKSLYIDGELVAGNLVIPEGVTSIGDQAFRGCSALTSVTFAEGSQLTSIGEYAFRDCSALTSIVIPDSVTSIGDQAFCGCSALTSVTIPAGVTSIGDYAFYNCSQLTYIQYYGTSAQWYAIKEGYSWNKNTGNYTIHCTDRDIAK